MPFDDKKKLFAVTDCDLCHERKGRNRTVYHILSFDDLEDLKNHLKSVFGDKHYCVDFFTSMFVTAHQIYGQRARDLYQPLWLVYLEAHGVEVKNRGDSIMKYRGQFKDGRMIEETLRPMIEGPKSEP